LSFSWFAVVTLRCERRVREPRRVACFGLASFEGRCAATSG
jgi:hypothetical protein